MKKFILVFVFSAFFFLNSLTSYAQEHIKEFDEYGVSITSDIMKHSARTIENESQWITFPSKSGIELNKVWTVSFSDVVEFDKIDAIVIEQNNQFIPVTITKNAQKQVQISPTYGFSGNANYTLKAFLTNGLKYKMEFKTKPQNRMADIENNDSYINASVVNINETISGTLSSKDRYDYYKIEVPANGKLDVTATNKLGGKLDLKLYGVNGSDSSSIRFDYGETAIVSAGIESGTYYISISTSSVAEYDLRVHFTENIYKDSTAGSSYVLAPEISTNQKLTGHIGYFNQYGKTNTDDYYKLTLSEGGIVTVNAKQLFGGNLSMYLYGAVGSDENSISSEFSVASGQFKLRLAEGTYYIRINNSGHSGAYELNTSFNPVSVKPDNATSTYITAPLINLNGKYEGQLGYIYDNRVRNIEDFYKIEIKNTGSLTLDAKMLNGGQLSMYLYGEFGTDKSYILREYNQKHVHLKENLTPGTYYIRLSSSSYADEYEMNLMFQ